MVTTCPPPFSSILSNSSPRSSTGPAHWKKIFHHHDLSLPMESFLSSCSCWKSKAYATSLIALTAWLKHEKLRQLPSQKTKIRWWRISWHLLRLEFLVDQPSFPRHARHHMVNHQQATTARLKLWSTKYFLRQWTHSLNAAPFWSVGCLMFECFFEFWSMIRYTYNHSYRRKQLQLSTSWWPT